jgi:excisionase family DNA binding protein
MPNFIQLMHDSGWVTVAEAAWLAGVHITTIYRLLNEGVLEETRHGRFRFVSRESLARYYIAPPIAARILNSELPELGEA